MDWIKNRTHIIDHPKFLDAGPLGRDLWQWGMNHAGKHETDGELSREAVLTAPWGAGTRKGNEKIAADLVRLGLWEVTTEGWRALRWKEQGNLTKAEIEANRQAARDRMEAKRKQAALDKAKPRPGRGVRANIERSSHDVPTSTSTSPSNSDLDLGEGVQGEAPRWSLDSPLPDTWRADADAQVTTGGERVDVPVEWTAYLADRLRAESRYSPSGADWRGWVLKAIKFARQDRLRGAALGSGPEPAKVARAPFHGPPPDRDDEPDNEPPEDLQDRVAAARAAMELAFGDELRAAGGA